MQIQSYKDLIVWQKSMDLVDRVLEATDHFPREHLYGLTAQIRKSAVSIPSNISEGSRRGTRKDFRNFLSIAFGSGAELETQILIVKRRTFGTKIDFSEIDSLLEEVMKMLNVLITRLKAKSTTYKLQTTH